MKHPMTGKKNSEECSLKNSRAWKKARLIKLIRQLKSPEEGTPADEEHHHQGPLFISYIYRFMRS